MSERFVIRESAVAAEIIDGEAIIMQLRTGLYFSSRGTGAVLWELFSQGVDFDSAVAQLATATGGDPVQILADVRAFAADAERHMLGETTTSVGDASPFTLPPFVGPWDAPVIEAFTDMQDLLLLDPIHDVADDKGWPQQKPV